MEYISFISYMSYWYISYRDWFSPLKVYIVQISNLCVLLLLWLHVLQLYIIIFISEWIQLNNHGRTRCYVGLQGRCTQEKWRELWKFLIIRRKKLWRTLKLLQRIEIREIYAEFKCSTDSTAHTLNPSPLLCLTWWSIVHNLVTYMNKQTYFLLLNQQSITISILIDRTAW